MKPFAYSRPRSLDAALDRLRSGDGARAISGGMTLIPTMKQGLAEIAELVDLADIDSLYGITEADGAIRIGAMTRHYDVATAPVVLSRLPGLASLAGGIGDLQVRNRGTIGGSVANNDPAADYPAALVALDATVITDRRSIAAERFFSGMFETVLEPGELVVAVRFPVRARSAYAKFRNVVSGYAMAGVFVADHPDGVRVAVTGASSCVFRAEAIEHALQSRFSAASVRQAGPLERDCIADLHGSAAYRAHLVQVMAARAVASLTGEGRAA